MRRKGVAAEDGISLVEILITIAIVGISFTAILGGIATSITASALQRKEASADAVARSAAEWVKDSVKTPYVVCAVASSYPLSGLVVPSGSSATITGVEYWTWNRQPVPSGYAVGFQATCPSPDPGLQRITIEGRSSDGQAIETVQVMKRIVP